MSVPAVSTDIAVSPAATPAVGVKSKWCAIDAAWVTHLPAVTALAANLP